MDTSFERTNASDDWITPPELVKSLGSFDLDPCACTPQPFCFAPLQYTLADDGLQKDWGGKRVWCNPPYGRSAAGFIAKLASHGNGILLIFARVETRVWFDYIWPKADAVLFLRGRLKFYRPNGTQGDSAGAASALIAYGKENVTALRALGPSAGQLIMLKEAEN